LQPAPTASRCHDDVDLEPHQLLGQRGQAIGMPFGVSVLDREIAPIDPA